ncbi:hypothetical protein Dimus_020416 [Dionaea muscipula]
MIEMTQDVEMKEPQAAAPSNPLTPIPPNTLQHLKEITSLIETGSYTKEVRRIARAVRLTFALRRKLTAHVLLSFLDFVLVPGSEPTLRLWEGEQDMEVDTATSAIQPTGKHLLPELEIYCNLLAKACSSASIARLKSLNRRTLDVLASKLYLYYSLAYELIGDLAEIRGELLTLHRLATLHHDELGQAEKLRSKAPKFEAHSNLQLGAGHFVIWFISFRSKEWMICKLHSVDTRVSCFKDGSDGGLDY